MQRFIVTIVLMACPIAVPEAQVSERLTFEVTSVRANRTGGPSATLQRGPGGSFSAINQTLRTLITAAYDVAGYQLVGAPDWTATERWDIVAKAAATSTSRCCGRCSRSVFSWSCGATSSKGRSTRWSLRGAMGDSVPASGVRQRRANRTVVSVATAWQAATPASRLET